VHDAARFFRLALEMGPAGGAYHCVAEEGMPLRDITGLIGRCFNASFVSKSRDEAARQVSFLAPFTHIDNLTSSRLTKERLGWSSTQTGLLSDLRQEACDMRLKGFPCAGAGSPS
jgi:hypothetical protein